MRVILFLVASVVFILQDSFSDDSLTAPAGRNLQDSLRDGSAPVYCGQLVGEHLMYGTYTYCGGLSVPDCSKLCYVRNFTYFQCEGSICHCFT